MRSKFLKNLQWKKKLKRLGALGLCALLIAGNLTIPDVAKAASPTAKYPDLQGETAIENALTYFQYMTSGDCTIGQHTVGAIAVGGTFTQTANTFGDGAQTASYANNIAFAKAPNLASGFRGVCNDVYYVTTDMSGDQLAGFTYNADYMDIPAIFNNIRTESSTLANSGTLIESSENRTEGPVNGKAIVVDFTGENGANGYTIPYEVLKNADFIDVRLNDISDLISKKCVINITGMDDVTDMFEMYGSSNAGGVSNNQLKVGVLFNGEAKSAIKDMASGSDPNSLGGQVFLDGMKLIFNLPDYTGTLRTECFEGHVVAPNATVIPGGGNMQGGVVAKEVFVAESNNNAQSAQAHYYPYNVPIAHYGCAPANASGDVCDSIIVNKVYKDGENIVPIDQCPPSGQGAKFTLYKWENGQRGDAVVENVEAVLYGDVHQVHILGTHLEKGKKYELVEISAAQGYDLSNTSIFCTVNEQKGDIYYSINSNDLGNLTIPTLENIKSATPKGLIEVTVQKAGSSDPISGIEVTIKLGENESRTVVTEDGKAAFTNLDAGEYEVSIPAENTGYELITDDSNETTVIVEGNQTATHTFTLTEAAQQPVTGSITVTVKENSAEGQGMDGVSVTVTSKDDSSVTDTRSTENGGTVTFDNLPLGTYTVSTTGKSGYTVKDSATADVSVTEEQNGTHEFILQQLANITVNVTCGGSGVDGVTVQVTKGEDSPVSHQTVGGGKVSLPGVEPDTYKVQITAPTGYTIDGEGTQSVSVPAGGNVTFDFALEEEVQTPTTGTINVVVKDTDNAPVGGVSVQVKNSQDVGVNLNAPETDVNGVTGKDDLTPDIYTVVITPPDGYVCEGPKEQTNYVNAGSVVNYVFTLAKCEDLKVVVIDTTTGEEVTGESVVTVSSGNNEVASSTFTGNDTFEDIKEGEYTVELTSYPNGYDVQGEASQSVTIDADDNITAPEVIFYLVPTGKITVTVQDDSDVDMNDVTVTLKSGGNVIATGDTVNGQVVFDSLADKTYTVEIEDVDGYEIKSKTPDSEIVISGGNEATCDFVLAQTQPETAAIKVVVKDEKGNPVEGVTVNIKEKSALTYPVVFEGETSEEGETEKTGLDPSYAHVVSITAPDDYTYVNNKKSEGNVQLVAGQTSTCEFTLAKTANLHINVIDTSTDTNYINTVDISIFKVENGILEDYKTLNSVRKDSNDDTPLVEGSYELRLDVTSIWPDNYVAVHLGEAVTVDPYTEDEYELTFYVTPRGTINVTVTKDGAPVSGQGVLLYTKDNNGNDVEISSGTTKTDGTLSFTNAPAGNYEVRVPVTEGNATVIKTQQGTLPAGGTEDVTIDLSTQSAQDKGSIRVSLRDDNGTPGGLIGGEGITIKKENGELIGTYYSRWDNEIVIPDLEPGNYTVTVEDLNNYVRVDSEPNTKEVEADGITTYNFVYSKRCSLKVEVRDRTSNELIASPEISVTNGSDVNEETSDVSEYTLSGLEAGTYTATVEAPDGYVLDGDATQSVSFDPYTGGTHNEPHTLTFYVVKTGTITVDVKENDTNGAPVSGISVTLQKKEDDGSYTNVGEAKNTVNGTVTFENVPEGNYKVVIPENNTGYATLVNAENEKNVSITPNDTTGEAIFYLTPVGKLEIHVKDDNPAGSSYVDGVTVTVKDKDGHIVSIGSQTTAGVITLEDLTPGEYTVTIGDKVGYVAKNNKKEIKQTVNAGDTATVYNFTLAKYAILKVNIYDITTGTPIHLGGDGDVIAKIEILRDNQSFHTKNLTYGNYTYEGVYAGEYKTTLTDLPAGYQVVSEGGNSVVTDIDPYDPNGPADGIYKVEFNVIKCGTVTVDVKENNANGAPVDGVKVTLYLDKGNHNYEIFGSEQTTGADGIVTFTDVPVRDYKVVISKENDGYEDLTDAQSTAEGSFDPNRNAKESFYLTPEQTTPTTGSLKVTVVEKGTTNNVPGVTVTITNKDDSTVQYYITTNDTNSGVLLFNNIPTGTYIVETTPSVTGYKTLTGAQSKCEVEVKATPQATHTFEYEPETADLIITVKDEKTNDPVPGAKVKITKKAPANGTSNQDESEVKETGNDGRIVMKGLRKGKYTTTVVSVPEGYNVTTDKEVVVDINPAAASEAQVDYKVGQVGALKVTITEKGTTNGIYGVQVAITTNASGTENTVYTYTDANGQVNLAGQKVGSYKISIPTSIAGYKELDAAYVVQTKDVEANKTTEYAFEVEKVTTADPNKGDAEIIVKDEVTGNPVPGASVIVTAPDNTNRKYTTDGNGKITIPQQDPGDYKVEVIEVPEGYTVTQNKQTTITVVAGATLKAEIMVKPAEGNSGVGGSEVAPPTVGSGQGEAGTTPDNNGGAVNTGGTSDNSGDVVNTGGATDSNNGGVITTGQTAGATNNKTTDAQSVSKQPKTGDETNPGIIWIILSVSACLAAASVIGLVYVKKKED